MTHLGPFMPEQVLGKDRKVFNATSSFGSKSLFAMDPKVDCFFVATIALFNSQPFLRGFVVVVEKKGSVEKIMGQL